MDKSLSFDMSDLFERAEGPLWGLERGKAASFAKGHRQHFFSIIRTRLKVFL